MCRNFCYFLLYNFRFLLYNVCGVISMRTAGIIAEYNPFHSGHKYQLDEVRKDCDAIIAVMSGSFVQRGDIAIADKRTRAKAAVINGCDLVLELPAIYSLSSAADFAFGGVSLLDKLGIVDRLYFGAECGDTQQLNNAAKLLLNESPEISERIKQFASEGMNYPAAYAKAWNGEIDADILTKPNNILALEYIKALIKLNIRIKPIAIKRVGAEHDGEPTNDIASASHLRKLIRHGEDYSKYVPSSAYELYKSADIYDISRIDGFITGVLRTCPISQIAAHSPEGLEHRIRSAAMENYGFNAICEAVKSKRYTLSRIRRIVLAAALNLPKRVEPAYARVLAMDEKGKMLLKEIKQKSDIQIITKTAAYNKGNETFDADIRATDIFSLCASDEKNRIGGRDYTTSPIVT